MAGRRGAQARQDDDQYRPKSFALPEDQIHWLKQLRAQALEEAIELDEVTIVRVAVARLMRAGMWRELKSELLARAAAGPRRGPHSRLKGRP